MIKILDIYPTPSPEEAVAIAHALARLVQQDEVQAASSARRSALRYADVSNGDSASGDLPARLTWSGLARLEALNV